MIAAFEDGKRPEEIRALHPQWKLWQIYAAIAVYLSKREVEGE